MVILMRIKDQFGQINSGIVWTIVVMLIAVSFGALIFGKVQTVADNQAAVDSMEDNIIHEVSATGATIFPLILLLVLIGVFVAIIGVLRVLG